MDIELYGNKLKVFENGEIQVLGIKAPYLDIYYKKKYGKNSNGYLQLGLHNNKSYKNYLVHRIIGYAYLGLDLENKKHQIDHIDRDTTNNNLSNLRIVTNQENNFNKDSKGYYFVKSRNKWGAYIKLNGIMKNLGHFDTEQEAIIARHKAKEKYYIINQYQ